MSYRVSYLSGKRTLEGYVNTRLTQATILALVLTLVPVLPALAQPATEDFDADQSRALVNQYCVLCHNPNGPAQATGLFFDQVDIGSLSDHAESAETVIRKLRAGLMPPYPFPRPDQEKLDSMIAWLESEVDSKAVTYLPPPGLHRLNRTEYTNTIRDMLALNIDANTFL
ncbi:MAG: mono/diheme cytochrome c family protein, partial [Pseudohongiellaceae bacterium]